MLSLNVKKPIQYGTYIVRRYYFVLKVSSNSRDEIVNGQHVADLRIIISVN